MMLKNILKLENAQELSKKDQNELKGGRSSTEGPITIIPGVTGEGQSQLCWGRPHGYEVIIDGNIANCTGNGGGYWFP